MANVVLSNKEFNVVGTRPVRHDGYDKVTGKAQYSNDIDLPGLLHAKILRSPHAHANIISIDTSAAEAHPDVKAVVLAADMIQGDELDDSQDDTRNNILATDKVLYKGHAVAAVAATSLHVAEEALDLINVEYEVLDCVTNVEDAIAENAPVLHEKYRNTGDDDLSKRPNVAAHGKLVIGNIDKGFEEADVVIEREYRTEMVHQGYIEPHAATAWWTTSNDRLTVWCISQGHFPIRDRISGVMGIPISQIKVVPMEIGGGFGGKTTIYVEPVAAVLSKKSGAPVKLAMSRADVLEASGPTSGSYMKCKVGAKKDGTITAAYAQLLYEAGAFPGSPVNAAANCIFSPYDIANVDIDAYDIVNNKPKTAAYRAPGAPGAAFASETVLDELADELGIDPIDFRIQNGAKEGTRRAAGIVNPVIGAIETAQAAKDSDHYQTSLEGPNRGRGVASGFWTNGAGIACAHAAVNYDGKVGLTIGTTDIGGSRPAAAMMFAEVLGIPVEEVIPQIGDTDTIGYSSMAGGSSVTFKTGWASYEAAQDVKSQMIGRAAIYWDVSEDQVDLVDGVFHHSSDPELKLSFKELAALTAETGGPVYGRANLDSRGAGPAYGTHVVDVEVDTETGKVTVLRYTAVQDAGKAIHPSYVEGQIQGGVAQGIGWALNEEYYMGDSGQMMNATLLDYRMPTSLDLPMLDTIIVEKENPEHPYGLRGAGEVPIVPPLAALANAIYDAIGVRMNTLPMNPSAVLKAIAEK